MALPALELCRLRTPTQGSPNPASGQPPVQCSPPGHSVWPGPAAEGWGCGAPCPPCWAKPNPGLSPPRLGGKGQARRGHLRCPALPLLRASLATSLWPQNSHWQPNKHLVWNQLLGYRTGECGEVVGRGGLELLGGWDSQGMSRTEDGVGSIWGYLAAHRALGTKSPPTATLWCPVQDNGHRALPRGARCRRGQLGIPSLAPECCLCSPQGIPYGRQEAV